MAKLSREEKAKANFVKKMDQLSMAFNAKLNEFQEWGFENGIMVDAYLKADHQGIFPYISWVEMTPEQIKMRDDYNAKMVKAESDAAKAEKQSQPSV